MTTTPVEDWVRAAMADESLVIELLLSLKGSPPPEKAILSLPLTPLQWGRRRPRSKTSNSAALRFDAAVSRKKEADSARCSPTTPLSWSGGSGSGGGSASPSATADGFEDSSRPSSVAGRFKITSAANENTTTTTATTAKRSRKKKTFSELKEEEILLLRESLNLKKELASLQVTCREERVRNDKLKRIKLDLALRSSKATLNDAETSRETKPEQSNQDVASTSCVRRPEIACIKLSASEPWQVTKTVSKSSSSFLLPDLNAMPSEEDPTCEAFCGIR